MNTFQKNNFGISSRYILLIINELKRFPQIEKTVIFGSRAMGNYKAGSDIDLAIFGKYVDFEVLVRLGAALNYELPIPYKVDIIHFESLKNQALKNHILKEGKMLYQKNSEED